MILEMLLFFNFECLFFYSMTVEIDSLIDYLISNSSYFNYYSCVETMLLLLIMANPLSSQKDQVSHVEYAFIKYFKYDSEGISIK